MSVTSIVLPNGYESGQFTPAFDKTGVNAANNVPGEEQLFTANADGVPQFFVPSFGPFFANNLLSVSYVNAQNVVTPLVAGVDYGYGFPFIGASRALGKAVYGCIVLYNEGLSGTLRITYQTVGGMWMLGATASQEAANQPDINAYWTSWEQLARYGVEFPIIDTKWDKPDPISMGNVLEATLDAQAGYYDALVAAKVTDSAALSHVISSGNPHNDTKETVGLGNVLNLPAATQSQASDANNTTSYVSSGQSALSILAAIPPASAMAAGLVKVNRGETIEDSVDASKALTAAGFVQMVKDRTMPISQIFNKSQIQVAIPRWPLTFPIVWQDNVYSSVEAWMASVGLTIGITPVEYSTRLGKIYLPAGTPPPDLTTTQYEG